MFQIENKGSWWPGIVVNFIQFSYKMRSAFGRAIIVDQKQCKIRIYPFFELINANKGIGSDQHINLGVSVRDFIKGSRRDFEELKEIDIKKCIYSSNTLHTNFVRPNGFLILNGEIICKPEKNNAMGLDCEKFMPLNGVYSALVFDEHNPGIVEIQFISNGQSVQPSNLPNLAMSGPILVKDGKDVSADILYRPPLESNSPYDLNLEDPNHERILMLPPGPTECNEVNFPPPATMTSFTAFGVCENKHILLISMFEGSRKKVSGINLGITIYEMAQLLVNDLKVTQAILGGGGKDTQQFLRGDQPEYKTAPVRKRPPDQGSRPEVQGERGLGAIIAVLK